MDDSLTYDISTISLQETLDNIRASTSELSKTLSKVEFDSQLLELSKNIRLSLSEVNYSSNLGQHLSDLEGLKCFSQVSLTRLNLSFNEKLFHSEYRSLLKKLKKKKTSELFKLYVEETDEEVREFICDYIVQKTKALSYKKLIKKIDAWKKKIAFYLLNFKRNERLQIRRIFSFHFKNLDDSHDYSII